MKLKLTNVLFWSSILFSLTVSISRFIPPSHIWVTGPLASITPIILTINIFIFIYLIFTQKFIKAIFPLLICIVSATVFFPSRNKPSVIKTNKVLNVLSFNTSFFHTRADYSSAYNDYDLNTKAVELIDWVKFKDADIVCLQEFYNDDDSQIFNAIEQIGQKGNYYSYFLNNPQVVKERKRGIITFSKYPIICSGKIFIDENGYNSASYVDIVRDLDTIRVINAHLQSREIGNSSKVYGASSLPLQRFSRSTLKRESQARQIIEFVKNSPYSKVIISGDFNSTPYSYPYYLLNKTFADAFANSGNGLGFTLNHNFLFFLRIDHQFHSSNLQSHYFIVHEDAPSTYHFPTECYYEIL